MSAKKTDIVQATGLLYQWLSKQVSYEALSWLDEIRQRLREPKNERLFFMSFSAIPRHTGKDVFELTNEDILNADHCRTGWMPQYWTVDQGCRTLLLLSNPYDDEERFRSVWERCFSSADLAEQVALFQALAITPAPQTFADRAAEGIRSNAAPVFNAVALNNPYPAEYLDQTAWNQLVLKAIFIGSPLHLIQGLDQRANRELAHMLVDFAHEREAANRSVEPQLWRPVGPFIDDKILADLEKRVFGPDEIQRKAAALALNSAPLPEAKELLDRQSDLKGLLDEGLDWDSFARVNH